MKIGGFQKISLLDYPDKISAIIWTIGCNLKCPFCYNTQLVNGKTDIIPEEKILSFLENRVDKLEAVVITGGEPLLQENMYQFLSKIKKLGYLIKIDTNGTYPDKLEQLLEEKLIDYVSMDIKAPKDKYYLLTGKPVDISNIEDSIRIIKKLASDYEFKTTIIPTLLDRQDILEIASWLDGAKRYYLQQFKNNTPLISEKLQDIQPYSNNYLENIIQDIKSHFTICETRGT
ncbi:MAG: anaerobic ribonucleoside-triphosphate reductase activating protein [Thermoplasmata archaeon]|nr:MAG: anaerobic ribonucleoside-triphosphate reductase activating protein [Thermoplasmata archaeon]HEC89028.1 anaerobic ribonucleoside-triphosphate reductase activating protein [Thermoplasmatales archaeon]